MAIPNYNIDLDINNKLKVLIPDFLKGIKGHSINNPVKSKVIENALCINGVGVRAIVQYLRQNHYPIGSQGSGYYYARNRSELLVTIEQLKARRTSLDKTINELGKIEFNELTIFGEVV